MRLVNQTGTQWAFELLVPSPPDSSKLISTWREHPVDLFFLEYTELLQKRESRLGDGDWWLIYSSWETHRSRSRWSIQATGVYDLTACRSTSIYLVSDFMLPEAAYSRLHYFAPPKLPWPQNWFNIRPILLNALVFTWSLCATIPPL